MIKIEHAYKSFNDLCIFKDLNIEIKNAGFYLITGKSGCGKTTLLNIIAGFETLDSGNIEVDENIAVIFQNYELVDQLSVYDNLNYCRNIDKDLFDYYADKLQIKDLFQHYPKELSGGQKQRVGILRALSLNPNIILCDEPYESLDVDNKEIVLNLLFELSKDKIVIIISHETKLMSQYKKTVFTFQNNQLILELDSNSNMEIKRNKKITYDNKIINKVVSITYGKSFFIQSIILVLLIICIQGFYLFQQEMFSIPTTHETLNANMMYVYTEDAEYIQEHNLDESKKIVIFDRCYYKNQLFDIIAYPYVSNDIKIVGEIPKENTVIVNQNVLSTLNISDYDNVKLEFTLVFGAYEEIIQFNIGGVVNEKDTNLMNVYFDLNYIKSKLSEIILPTGITGIDYFNNFMNDYQLEVGYSNIQSFIAKNSQSGVEFVNPLYEERLQLESDSKAYKLLFYAIVIILVVSVLLCLYVFTLKEISYNKKSISIFVSQGIDLNKFRITYFKIKTFIFLISFIILEILSMIYFMNIYELVTRDYLILISTMIVFIIKYTSLNIICLNKIRYHLISTFLKNE